MFYIYIQEAATKQEFYRSRSLKFSLQQEPEPESNIPEQDWIRSQKFWTPITSASKPFHFRPFVNDFPNL